MMCAWNELLGILPARMRSGVDRQGRDTLQEIRLRINAPPELVLSTGSLFLQETASREDLNFCVNTASRYSPWASATASKGYITAPGGHRIGLCGTVVCQSGIVTGIQELHSLCIRVARDFPGISKDAGQITGSVLILGAPGWGKTTLLRDLCRRISEKNTVSVVDERGELYPPGFERGKRMDVLSGCPKTCGIEMLLRTMGPEYIAVDEITAREDCEAMIRASNCGVHLIATAHAASLKDYFERSVYRAAVEQKLFHTILVLRPDKSYTVERITLCI